MISLLDFYQKHDISPVRQAITDLPAHFARRAGLYRSLGLPPFALQGKSVLEIGPGSGCNALYTFSLQPSRYVAVEPNPRGADETRARFGSFITVVDVPIENYAPHQPFDVVLCEGLPGLCGTDPLRLLEAAVRHVAPGGVLVLTCIDPISDHAEVLRRSMAQQLIDRSAPLADQVALLRPIFAPHLATLKGMTRSVDDWIVDNLLNPASIGPTFSIPQACEALDGRFKVTCASPRGILADWHWYKDPPKSNQWAIDAYWTQAHNLLDYRTIEPPRTEAMNRALMGWCEESRQALRDFEAGTGPAPDESLTDIGWFGRGQQYLSFVRAESD